MLADTILDHQVLHGCIVLVNIRNMPDRFIIFQLSEGTKFCRETKELFIRPGISITDRKELTVITALMRLGKRCIRICTVILCIADQPCAGKAGIIPGQIHIYIAAIQADNIPGMCRPGCILCSTVLCSSLAVITWHPQAGHQILKCFGIACTYRFLLT